MLPYSGRAFGPGRGLRTRELCAGWGLGRGEFLFLLFALACREDSVLDPTSEQLEDSALDWTLERGWALRKPWAGLWHMGGPQPTARLWQARWSDSGCSLLPARGTVLALIALVIPLTASLLLASHPSCPTWEEWNCGLWAPGITRGSLLSTVLEAGYVKEDPWKPSLFPSGFEALSGNQNGET